MKKYILSSIILLLAAVNTAWGQNVATVNGTGYTTLADALNAAREAAAGGWNTTSVTVEILEDITFSSTDTWTPIVYNQLNPITINGNNKTITNLPGMLYDKKGSGVSTLTINNLTFESPTVILNESGDNDLKNNTAVIMGYADSVEGLYFNNVTINNATVTGANYVGAFVGYAAGYSNTNDGPLFQTVKFNNCKVTNSTLTSTGGGSVGALMGHAAGSTDSRIEVEETTVSGNNISTTKDVKAGALFGTVGNAQATTNHPEAGLFVSANVSNNTVTANDTPITTIYGRRGSEGELTLTNGGSYDKAPIAAADMTEGWAGLEKGTELTQNSNGTYSVEEAKAFDAYDVYGNLVGSYATLNEAIQAGGNGCTVKMNQDAYGQQQIDSQMTPVTFDLNGHTLYAEQAAGLNFSMAYYWNGDHVFTIKDTPEGGGINITPKYTGNACISDNTGRTIIVEGGTFTSTGKAVYCTASNGSMTINGGTFNGEVYVHDTGYGHGDLSITDGTFNGTLSAIDNAEIAVSGGTFSQPVLAAYCAPGYEPVEISTGVYSVQVKANVVATIGSTEYQTLEAAIDAATDGQTITMLADVELDNAVDIDKSITLNLGGKTISISTANEDGYAISISSGTVTITGDGTIDAALYVLDGAVTIENGTFNTVGVDDGSLEITDGMFGALMTSGGTTTVNGGTFSETVQGYGGNLTIAAGTFTAEGNVLQAKDGGTITVTSGTFTATQSGEGTPIVALADQDGLIQISGGTFTGGPLGVTDNTNGKFEVSGGQFSDPVPEEYCADGYIPTDQDPETGKYSVKQGAYVAQITVGETTTKYETLADAFAAANAASGSTLTLLNNVEVTNDDLNGVTDTPPYLVTGNFTLDLNGKTIEYTGTSTLTTGVIGVKRGGDLTVKDSSNPSTGEINSGANAYAAIAVTVKGEAATGADAKLTVNSGTLTGNYYAVTGNGNRHGTNITVSGGNLEGTNGSAIYQPQNGTLTISDGKLKGGETGIEVRSGTLNVTGGTFETTATTYSCTPNGNGTTTVGAAIAISQHTTNKVINATISGGTFVANGTAVKLSVSNPQNNPFTNVTVNSLSGLTENSEIPEGYMWAETATAGVYTLTSAVAKIGNTPYNTLQEAINAAVTASMAASGTEITVELLTDVTDGTGLALFKNATGTYPAANGANVKIDFGGYTYTVAGPAVGSPNTQNQALHFEQGNTITLTNGTINMTTDATALGAFEIFMQNYGTLIIDDMTIDGTGIAVATYSDPKYQAYPEWYNTEKPQFNFNTAGSSVIRNSTITMPGALGIDDAAALTIEDDAVINVSAIATKGTDDRYSSATATVTVENGAKFKLTDTSNAAAFETLLNANGQSLGTAVNGVYTVKSAAANMSINDPSITVTVEPATYTGTAITPVVTVSGATGALVKDQDYTITFDGTYTNAKTYSNAITITGIGGYYTDTRKADFVISPRNINDVTVSGNTKVYTEAGYTVDDIKASIVLKYTYNTTTKQLEAGETKDYTITVDDTKTYKTPGTYAGVITLTAVEGEGKNYTGSRTVDFMIGNATDIANCDITVPTIIYNGKEQLPAANVTVKNGSTTLTNNADYEISFANGSNFTNAGTTQITITGKGSSYYGSKTVNYTIERRDIATCSINNSTLFGDGSVKDPAAIVTITYNNGTETLNLVKATENALNDYTITVSAGYVYQEPRTYTGALTITGNGNYKGTVTKDFVINNNDNPALNLATALVTSTAIYNGAQQVPSANNVVVKIANQVVDPTNYVVTYTGEAADYKDAKTYAHAVVITATGSAYYGKLTADYVIAKRDMLNVVAAETAEMKWTGNTITPNINTDDNKNISLTLTTGPDGNQVVYPLVAADYTYTTQPAVIQEPGLYTFTFEGRGNFTGTKTLQNVRVLKNMDTQGGNIKLDLADSRIILPATIPPATESAKITAADITVKDGATVLTQGVDYSATIYSKVTEDDQHNFTFNDADIVAEIQNDPDNGKDDGIYWLKITGLNNSYEQSKTLKFYVLKEYYEWNRNSASISSNYSIHLTDAQNASVGALVVNNTTDPVTVENCNAVATGLATLTIEPTMNITLKDGQGSGSKSETITVKITDIEPNAFDGCSSLSSLDASKLVGFTPNSLNRNSKGTTFYGIAKQALIYLNGTTFKGENYVYTPDPNPSDNSQYFCELFKIYDDFSGSQTGFTGNDYRWDLISQHGFTAYTIENMRQFAEGRHYTVCLPYSIPIPKNVKAYTLDATSDKLFGFKEVGTGTLEAYTPYVLIPTTSGQLLSTINAEVPSIKSGTQFNPTQAGNYTLYGTMSYMDGTDAAGKYIMQYNNGNPTWKKITETNAGFNESNKACILPMRAYIINDVGGSREFFEVIFTNIDGTTLTFDKLRFDDDAIYDLSGRKVQNVEHGHTYIINGKKIMIK